MTPKHFWKAFLTGLAAIAGIALITSCDQHKWEGGIDTLYQDHHGHGDDHDGEGDHDGDKHEGDDHKDEHGEKKGDHAAADGDDHDKKEGKAHAVFAQ